MAKKSVDCLTGHDIPFKGIGAGNYLVMVKHIRTGIYLPGLYFLNQENILKRNEQAENFSREIGYIRNHLNDIINSDFSEFVYWTSNVISSEDIIWKKLSNIKECQYLSRPYLGQSSSYLVNTKDSKLVEYYMGWVSGRKLIPHNCIRNDFEKDFYYLRKLLSFSTKVTDYALTADSCQILINNGIDFVGQLVKMGKDEIIQLKGSNDSSYEEICKFKELHGIKIISANT